MYYSIVLLFVDEQFYYLKSLEMIHDDTYLYIENTMIKITVFPIFNTNLLVLVNG